MSEIVLEGVTKRFADGTTAVRDATFSIHDGELFILVGPSGCGKSTLLNMIVGLEEMSGGDLRVDGRSMRGVDPKDRDMAMVFQSYAIYLHMSVRENIAFPLKLAKMSVEETALRVRQVAELLGLGELLDRKPETLSGGKRQRVAMGGPWCGVPRSSCSMSPCPIWTPSSAARCEPNWHGSSAASA